MNLAILPLAAAATSSAASSSNTMTSYLYTFLPIILIFVIFYFFMIMPQRKKDKEVQKMRSRIEVGDEVTTVGGVMGRIVTIKDDTIVIETGADRNKIRIHKWAIQSVDTVHDNAN